MRNNLIVIILFGRVKIDVVVAFAVGFIAVVVGFIAVVVVIKF